MPDGEKLASVAQSGAMVHGFQICWHGEKEEREATSMGRISWAEKASHGACHGRQWRGLTGVLG
jgi:hypothetical protein